MNPNDHQAAHAQAHQGHEPTQDMASVEHHTGPANVPNHTGTVGYIGNNNGGVNANQGGASNVSNANNNGIGLAQGAVYAAEQYMEEIDANVPAWATESPVDGYIMHPVAGPVMHPSFYDNRHLIDLETHPRYLYDGEVDGPLCTIGSKCNHVKDCFEVRVRMAVWAYRRHHISFKDAEYIWSVSRSTIQRRKAAMDKLDPLVFLLTPENTGYHGT